MNLIFQKFIKKLIVFTMVLFAVALLSKFLLPISFVTPALLYLIPLFFSITLLTHYLLLKGSEKSFAKFTTNYMLVTFSKLMLLLIVLLLYVFTHKSDAIPFIISFFLLYILFAVFEAIELQDFKK
jgi:hypothetical protein